MPRNKSRESKRSLGFTLYFALFIVHCSYFSWFIFKSNKNGGCLKMVEGFVKQNSLNTVFIFTKLNKI